MAINLIASVFVPSNTTSGNINSTGGNCIIAFSNRYGAVNSFSDNKGNVFTSLGDFDSSGMMTRVYYCLDAIVGTNHNFTVGNQSTNGTFIVAVFSNVKTADAYQAKTNHAGQYATNVQAGSITPDEDNSLILAGYADYNTVATFAINSGFTIIDDRTLNESGNHLPIALAYKVQTTKNAENPTWTLNASYINNATLLVFKPIPAPDSTPPSDVTNLMATKISNSQVNIDSDAATDNVAVGGYQTQRRINGGSWSDLIPVTKAFSDTAGFPTTPGDYTFEYRRKAFDSVVGAPNFSVNWAYSSSVTITILPPPPVADFTLTPTSVVIGGTITADDTSTNNPTSRQWKLGGVNHSTTDPTTIDTTGLALGDHTVRLDVANAGGSDFEEKTFTVTATPPPVPVITSNSPLKTARIGHPYTIKLNASGGSGSGSYQMTVGNLPNGAMAADGTITIANVGSSNYSFTIRYTDNNGQYAEKAFTIPVSALAVFDFCAKYPLQFEHGKKVRIFKPRQGARQTRTDSPKKRQITINLGYYAREKQQEILAFWDEHYPEKNFLFFDDYAQAYFEAYISTPLTESRNLNWGGIELVIEEV